MWVMVLTVYFASEGSRHRLWDLLNSYAGRGKAMCARPYTLNRRLLGFQVDSESGRGPECHSSSPMTFPSV